MSSPKKRICVLGSTGSVGVKTLEVVADHRERFEIVGLSAHSSADLLAEQAQRHSPVAACLSGGGQAPSPNGATRWLSGAEGLVDLIGACEPDVVVMAVVGAAGLEPTLKALEAGVTVALANKETLVTAGRLVMECAARSGARILPIDSEHCAIFQCLEGRSEAPVRRAILTASGGPFRGFSRAQLENVSVRDALNHPTWRMGRKITIDSATLMNKGFEVIEGHHLFDLEPEKFEVVIHPQSLIHSMVEFADGSIMAQLGVTDMYFPIAHALAYPERLVNDRFEPLNLTEVGALQFEDFDRSVFPCLGYAYEAARRGGTYPTALNAANEVAVERFLDGALRFVEIPDLIDAVLQAHQSGASDNLNEIRRADAWARDRAGSLTFTRT